MTIELIALILLSGAVFNRVRGSLPKGDWIFALLWGILCAVMGYEDWQCVLSGLLMFAAQASGWGVIFGAVGGWFDGEYKAPAWIKWLLQPLEGDLQAWGTAALALRGLHFIAPALPLLSLPMGLGMALTFYVMYTLGIVIENKDKRVGWEWAEYAFGFGLAAVLIIN